MSQEHLENQEEEQITVTTCRDTPRGNPNLKRERLKKSTYLAYLWFLQRSKLLTEGQGRYLLQLQSKIKLSELESAVEKLRRISESPRSAARSRGDLEYVKRVCPDLPAKLILREPRRIGIGYRDKGTLRPLHKPVPVPGFQWWSEDLAPFLFNPPEEPQWISSGELFGKEGYDHVQLLALMQVVIHSQTPLPPETFQGEKPKFLSL